MNRLLLDIGNSTIVVALADGEGNVQATWRIKTLKNETLGYFRREMRAALTSFSLLNKDGSYSGGGDGEQIVILSVVPEINDKVAQAVIDITGVSPSFFSLDDALRVMNVDVESPSQVGKDRLADAIAARCFYGAPAIAIDLGTATTVNVINSEGDFIGGMIMPGVKTSLKALTAKASQLPMVTIDSPRNIIGRNTLESMQSGVIYGNAAMIDGLIDQITAHFTGEVKIVATGGMAQKIIPHCRHNITVDPYLVLKGVQKAMFP